MGHEKNKEESSQVNWWIAINQLSGKLDLICCLWCIDALNSAKCYTTWHCISSPSELIVNNTTSHLGGNQVYDSVGGEWWRLPTPQFLRSIPWLTNDTFIQPFSAVSVFVANSMPFIGTHFLANTGTESFCPQTQHHHQTNRCVAVYWQSNPSHLIARHHFPSNGSDSLSPTHTHTPLSCTDTNTSLRRRPDTNHYHQHFITHWIHWICCYSLHLFLYVRTCLIIINSRSNICTL